MKRIEEHARAPDSATGSARGAADTSNCASAAELAGVLLAHTMQESEAPIAQLSEALARVARSLTGGSQPGPQAEVAALRLEAARGAIIRDLAVCIENLQFHDRLMQQLTRVHDILAALAANRRLIDIPAQVPGQAAKSGHGSIELF